MSTPAPRRATLEDFLAIGEEVRDHELIDGEIVERASPSGAHGGAQADLVIELGQRFGRAGGGGPAGWWFATEVELRLGDDVCRPDLLGWRRERVPERPRSTLVDIAPDWVCEILSPTNARHDLVQKKRLYHRHSIPHYWILDPTLETLSVHRHHADGYIEVLVGERGQRVRAEPFDAIELAIDTLFGHG